MPNVPIVTSVTKAELDALVAANGLNKGLQYEVTDKGWLLIATGTNQLISQQSLSISNTEVNLDYIYAENIHWDSGIITDNISSSGGNPILINRPDGYICEEIYFQSNCPGDSYLTSVGISIYIDPPIDEMYTQKIALSPNNLEIYSGTEQVSADGVGGVDGNTLRCIVTYKKSFV